MNNKTLTTGEVAGFCGVNFRTVIRWIDKGILKGHRLPGARGDHRVLVLDLIEFMTEGNMPIPENLMAISFESNDLEEVENNRLLIIEDEKPVANAINRAIRKLALSVEMAHDGFTAGLKLSEFKPKIVTLDMQMPGIHGLVVLNLIKTDFPHIKVIVISAADEYTLNKAKELGADKILEKPFDNEILRLTIEELS